MSNPNPSPGQIQSQTQGLPGAAEPLEYSVPAGLLDEVHAADGSVRPQWRYLLDSFRDLGPAVLDQREEKIRRILRDDGATYNLHGGESRTGNAWELDAAPNIIGSEDWAHIESGLLERAELFNLILRDLYGPRTLLRHSVLPPEALFSHNGFLRACQGIQLPGEHQLILHAVDMVRRPDGSMCVLSDRTQAPNGAGYVLENRTVMSRVFPSIYRESHVHRIASFYQRLRLKLTSLSPTDDPPCIALLTHGDQDETRFEYAYLANYLGLPLVQSGDLVVRNGFLWMKSLDGLTRVDVLLRQVDDLYCDPVELRSDSRRGVPGLLEVIRSGRVAVVNPLGCGVLENPVLLKFLPQISRALLGREPRLSSVKTYWCGDQQDLAFVTANIRQLIIKPIFRGSGVASVWGGDLGKEQQAELLARINRNPYQFVGQERLDKAHLPTFTDRALVPRPFILRTFSIAADSSYMVMPGGMTRIGQNPGGGVISMQSTSPSKDTWVTATEPEHFVQSEAATDSLDLNIEPAALSLPSRVVENLYWMGRYAERGEAGLRLLRTVFVLLNGEEPINLEAKRILLQAVTKVTGTLPGFMDAADTLLDAPDEELLQVIRNGSRVGSIKSTLNSMLASAQESKELLSTDTLRVINDLYDELDSMDSALAGGLASAPEEALDPLVTGLVALSGLMQENMVRSVGWRFMELGKRVERAKHIITTLRVLTAPVAGEADRSTLLIALLTTMDVAITYRRRGRQRAGIELGLELVMLDPGNPRSLLFQLERLQHHLMELPGMKRGSRALEEEERTLLAVTSQLKLARLPELLAIDNGKRPAMEALLSQLEDQLANFNTLISDKHFDHRTDTQQLLATISGGVS